MSQSKVMSDIAAKDINFSDRGAGRSYQEVLADDKIEASAGFREKPEMELGSADVSNDRYISQEWHNKEVDKVWRKTWQVACREEQIPDVGDYVVYDIVDDSLIVVRTAEDEIRAYYNACLHRGNALCLDKGHADKFRCPYHGFTWGLGGDLRYIPSQWDFKHVDKKEFSLPEAKVDIWGGFVFVNLDPDCGSLTDYLEILPAHLDEFEFEKRYIAVHVTMVAPCNWKVAQETFIEGYHVAETHYDKDANGNVDPDGIAAYTNDVMMQYDVWPESQHVTRMILAGGVPSEYVAHHERSEQHIIDQMLYRLPGDARPIVGPGQTARRVLADHNRKALSAAYGVDLSKATDSNMMDQCEYTLFPNFTFWPTLFAPLLYRFRPHGHNPDESIFEVYMLHPIPEDGRAYETAKEIRMEPGQLWSTIPELGAYGPILDQDTPNMIRMTKGLKTTRKRGATFANYQENRIRHFHQTLDEYMGK